MANSVAAQVNRPVASNDRRGQERPTMVLRVGLLQAEGKSSYCLLRNISSNGVQVRLYAPVREGLEVDLRVGDESPLPGRIVWVRDGFAGIAFKSTLAPTTLLRVRQMGSPRRRRASPRVQAAGFAMLRTGGQEYSAKLCDISTSGAKIVTTRSVKSGPMAVLLLPMLPALRAFVRWTQGQETGLVFETPMPIQVISQWLIEQPDMPVR